MEWIVKKILSERNVIVESVMSKEYDRGEGLICNVMLGSLWPHIATAQGSPKFKNITKKIPNQTSPSDYIIYVLAFTNGKLVIHTNIWE